MARALAAGVAPAGIVFSGVGKTHAEMEAGLETGIGQFNLESEEEGAELARIAAARGLRAACALRVNPDVDAGTHEKISTGKAENKFGVPISRAEEIFAHLSSLPGLDLRGVAVHIGSQLTSLEPMEPAFTRLGELIVQVARARSPDQPRRPRRWAWRALQGRRCPAEPGRIRRDGRPGDARLGCRAYFRAGSSDIRQCRGPADRVIRVKRAANGPPFVVVDAAMNDLARPALYGAWHDFEAVRPSGNRMTAHIVGPICETGDTFARDRDCDAVEAGDLAVFRTAGAYGATMASSYNSRGFVAEVLVDGDKFAVVADRILPERSSPPSAFRSGSLRAFPSARRRF